MDRCHGSKNDDGLIDCTYGQIFRLSLVGRRRRGAIRRQAVMRANKPASSRGCPLRRSPRPLSLSLVTGVAIEAPKRRCPPLSLHYHSALFVHLNTWDGIDTLSSSSSSLSSVSSSLFLPTFVFPLFRPSFILLDSSGFLVSSGSQ